MQFSSCEHANDISTRTLSIPELGLAGCNNIAELAHGSRHVAGLWPSKYFLSVLSCAALKLLDLQLGTVSPQSGWPIAAGSQAAAGPAREMNVAKI